jgi:Phage major capsid protein E/Phage portal protein, lambda family
VGCGIKPSSLVQDRMLKDQIQRLWLAWTDEADADGLTDFYGLQTMAARAMFEAGECFFRFRAHRPEDGLTVPLQLQKPYFFPVGVPGLFRQYNAPADFVETANTIGLPRYAKQAVDQQFARWVMLHVQSNPLPICTRPRVLIKGKRT